MDKSILMQKQVKDNAEDLQKEFLDMKNWEEQMRCKDEQLRKEKTGQVQVVIIFLEIYKLIGMIFVDYFTAN